MLIQYYEAHFSAVCFMPIEAAVFVTESEQEDVMQSLKLVKTERKASEDITDGSEKDETAGACVHLLNQWKEPNDAADAQGPDISVALLNWEVSAPRHQTQI